MTPPKLLPCPSCVRHVKSTETSCPFCGASIRALAMPPQREPPSARAARAAALVVGASIAVGCGGTTVSAPSSGCVGDGGLLDAATGHDAGAALDGGATPDAAAPADALAPIDSGALDGAASDGPADEGGVLPIYGAPEVPDADLTAVPDAGS